MRRALEMSKAEERRLRELQAEEEAQLELALELSRFEVRNSRQRAHLDGQSDAACLCPSLISTPLPWPPHGHPRSTSSRSGSNRSGCRRGLMGSRVVSLPVHLHHTWTTRPTLFGYVKRAGLYILSVDASFGMNIVIHF